MALITEEKATIKATLPQGDVHAGMEIFYNPVMKSNRTISIVLLNSILNKEMKIADILAGSGMRSLRFLGELKKGKIKTLFVNDHKEHFKETFSENCRLSGVQKLKEIVVGNEDAVLFLFQNQGFDYIDIDPFGSPNPFLAAAIARISRDGILAVTATDTAALTGTYTKATRRKYWAEPLRNYLMHEIGLRILIRRVQLQGIQFEKALTPVLAYHKDHYFRIYFRAARSKEKCDELMQQQRYFLYCHHCSRFQTSLYNKEMCKCGHEFVFAGPLWIGPLSDTQLLDTMVRNNSYPEEQKFLELLYAESKVNAVGFYDLHNLAHRYKIEPPKMDIIISTVKGVRTHFSPTGIRTDKDVEAILEIMGVSTVKKKINP